MNPELWDVNVHAPTVEERHREQPFREHGGKTLTRLKNMPKKLRASDALYPR